MDPRKAHLDRMLAYDLWANSLWAAHIDSFPSSERPRLVAGHILSAQRAWLKRLRETFEPDRASEYAETATLTESFVRTNAEWVESLSTLDLDSDFSYTRVSDGTQATLSVGDVFIHVVNHGTYHRGHLRGLAEAQGLEHFPDTDWTLWLRSARTATPA